MWKPQQSMCIIVKIVKIVNMCIMRCVRSRLRPSRGMSRKNSTHIKGSRWRPPQKLFEREKRARRGRAPRGSTVQSIKINNLGGAGSGGNRSPGVRSYSSHCTRRAAPTADVSSSSIVLTRQGRSLWRSAHCRTTAHVHAPRRCRCALLRRKEAVCDRRGIRAGHRQPLCSLDSLVATRPELMLRLDSSPMAVSGIEAVSHLGARRSLALGHRDEL